MTDVLIRSDVKQILNRYANFTYITKIGMLNKRYYDMYLYSLQEYKVVIDTIKRLSIPNIHAHYPYWIVLSVNMEYKKTFNKPLTNPRVIEFFLNKLWEEYPLGYRKNAYYHEGQEVPFDGVEMDPRYYFGWDGLSNNWIDENYNGYFNIIYFKSIYDHILNLSKSHNLPIVVSMNTRMESNPPEEYIEPFIKLFTQYTRAEIFGYPFLSGNTIYANFDNLFKHILEKLKNQ